MQLNRLQLFISLKLLSRSLDATDWTINDLSLLYNQSSDQQFAYR